MPLFSTPFELHSYLFVDGRYLTERLREWSARFTEGNLISVDYSLFFKGHEKIFYYDALPSRKPNESADVFGARLAEAEAHHTLLRAVDGCHVFNGKTVEGDRRIRQKGVDVLLATHILTHVFRKNVKRLTLLAGDSDFAPLVDFAPPVVRSTRLRLAPLTTGNDAHHFVNIVRSNPNFYS